MRRLFASVSVGVVVMFALAMCEIVHVAGYGPEVPSVRSHLTSCTPAGGSAVGTAQKQPGRGAAAEAFFLWKDPEEGAFTVELPRDWHIKGGTVRTSPVEPHYVVRAQSPDGGIRMFNDDPGILPRQVPNMITASMGWREGQMIPSAWGGRLLLEPYRPAPAVAQEYARTRLCPTATDFEGGIIPGQSQDLNEQMGAVAASEGKQVHVDVGEVSFQCGAQVGYVYAITLQAWQPGGPVSMWFVYRIAGYLAQPHDASAAAGAMHRLLGTFQMDPGWLQRFAQQAGDFAGNVIRESNAVTRSTMERARQEDAAMEARIADWKRNSDARSNAIEHAGKGVTGSDGNGHDSNAQLGTKRVCDDLGRCQSVDASVTNWYSDCSGTFYPASESGEPPSASLSACWNRGH